MNYHLIRTDDMLNGSGLRVVVFMSGCDHHCPDCHNPQTWSPCSGKLFDTSAVKEIFKELDKDYISGVTFSGGDPLHENNIYPMLGTLRWIKKEYPNKTIWLYTGYTLEELYNKYKTYKDKVFDASNVFEWAEYSAWATRLDIIQECDVVCDGRFKKELADVNFPWVGSTNQRVIDMKTTIKNKKITLLKEDKG